MKTFVFLFFFIFGIIILGWGNDSEIALLLEHKKIDEVIKILQRKAELSDTEKTYLAFAYNEYALKILEDQPQTADKYFEKAIKLCPSLFVYRFNFAVKTYKQKRFRKTLSLLYDYNPTVLNGKKYGSALLLIALSYFHISEYSIALKYFEVLDQVKYSKVSEYMRKCYSKLGFDKNNEIVKVELHKQLKTQSTEHDIEKQFLDSSSEHFNIKSNFASPHSYSKIFQYFEQAYFQLGRNLNFYPSDKINVYLYRSKKQFQEATSSPDWVGGLWDGKKIKIPETYLTLNKKAMKRIIFHEYVHCFFSLKYRKSRGRLPLWLNEGCAEYFSIKYSSYQTYNSNYRNYQSIKDLSKVIGEFIKKSGYYYRSKNLYLAYFFGYKVVEFIMLKKGILGLDKLIKAFVRNDKTPFLTINYTEKTFVSDFVNFLLQ